MRATFFRNLLLLFVFTGVIFYAKAQNASRVYIEPTGWSLGTNIGWSDLWGDVGTKSVLDHYTNSNAFQKACFMGGLFARYTMHPCLSFRAQFNIGALYASDDWNYDRMKVAQSIGEDGYQRYARNQKAKDYLGEGLLLAEFTPKRMNPESKGAHKRGQPFIGAGIGLFYFVPYSTLANSNKWVQTYDLHLEGEGWGAGYPKQYSLWQPCIPMVVGYKWDMGKHFNLGVELMYRMTFFSYLDGVSYKYVDSSQFRLHLTPEQTNYALQMYDKGYLRNPAYENRNVAGSSRGSLSGYDSYSTITITFYYKVYNRWKEWWKM